MTAFWKHIWKRIKDSTFTDWVNVLLTAGILLVAFLQWKVYTKQLDEMVSGGADTRNLVHSEVEISKAASKSAEASSSFARSSQDAVNKLDEVVTASQRAIVLGQESAILDRRPWVIVDDAEVQIEGNELTFTYRFRNVGKTPANKVKFCRVLFDHDRKPGASDDDFSRDAEDALLSYGRKALTCIAAAPLGPDQVAYQNLVPDLDITPATLKLLRENKKRVYIYGTLNYEDLLGRPGKTRFCHFAFSPVPNKGVDYSVSNCAVWYDYR